MRGQRVILGNPSSIQPTPTSPLVFVPKYLRLSSGWMPARPGGTAIGTTYSALPCSVTRNAPATAPTAAAGAVGGSWMTSSPPSPSGTVSGLSGGGATHRPEPSWQSSPAAHVPQDLPHFGSLPHCRPSQDGVHSRHSPHGASGPPQFGGSITLVAQSQGRQDPEPSGCSRQQSPGPHTMSLEQAPPRSQTP